ncbi:hypothetical protein [Luteibacter sp. E-22]|uniref:hypothetical protein n=1 Tax=Luteibacter sp. E-22 TaxID=3404050 RepID=UPI003CEA2057
MTVRDELEKIFALGHSAPTVEGIEALKTLSVMFLRDHGPALLEALDRAKVTNVTDEMGGIALAIWQRSHPMAHAPAAFKHAMQAAIDHAIDRARRSGGDS